jgi:hypothetical protein
MSIGNFWSCQCQLSSLFLSSRCRAVPFKLELKLQYTILSFYVITSSTKFTQYPRQYFSNGSTQDRTHLLQQSLAARYGKLSGTAEVRRVPMYPSGGGV